jgi:hypothetical protein
MIFLNITIKYNFFLLSWDPDSVCGSTESLNPDPQPWSEPKELVGLMVKSVEAWVIREFGPSLVHPTVGLDSFKAFTVEYHSVEETNRETDIELGKQSRDTTLIYLNTTFLIFV